MMLSLTQILGIAVLITLVIGIGVLVWSVVDTRRRYYADFIGRRNQNGRD